MNPGKVARGLDTTPSKYKYISKNNTAQNLQENALCEETLVFLLGASAVLKVAQSKDHRSKNRINPLICHYTGANILIFRASRKSQDSWSALLPQASLSPTDSLINSHSLKLFHLIYRQTAAHTEKIQNVKVYPGFLWTLDVLHGGARAGGRERTGGGKQRSW